MIVRDFSQVEAYEPTGHHNVVNRLLAGLSWGDGDALSVWHGRLNPGGSSELHLHESSLQIYVVISGQLTVGDGRDEWLMGPLGTAVIEPGSSHFIENRSPDEAEVLVISTPALR